MFPPVRWCPSCEQGATLHVSAPCQTQQDTQALEALPFRKKHQLASTGRRVLGVSTCIIGADTQQLADCAAGGFTLRTRRAKSDRDGTQDLQKRPRDRVRLIKPAVKQDIALEQPQEGEDVESSAVIARHNHLCGSQAVRQRLSPT